MSKNILVPFDQHGNMKNYVGRASKDVTFVVIAPFTASLTIEDIIYGQTSKNMRLVDDNGISWIMFESEWHRLFLEGRFNGLRINGTWRVRKVGQHYGLVEAINDK